MGRPRKPIDALRLIAPAEAERRPGGTAMPRGVPEPPADLTGDALDEWRRVVPILARVGVLCEVHREILGAYCRAVSDRRKLLRVLDVEGFIVAGDLPKRHPAAAILREREKAMLDFARCFGMTPESAAKVPSDPAAEPTGKARFFGGVA